MKPIYFDATSRTIADLVELAPSYYLITRINVPKESRGRSLGSEMLKKILADADAEGATLEIHPMPSGGLTRKQLISWYERYGFRMAQSYISQEPIKVLVREPETGGK